MLVATGCQEQAKPRLDQLPALNVGEYLDKLVADLNAMTGVH